VGAALLQLIEERLVPESRTPPEWLNDPEFVVFAGDAPPPPGASEEHSFGDAAGTMFARRRDAVRQDWERRVGQIRSLLEDMPLDAGTYALDEVTFELGFSAEGQIVFVAKGGVTTTIRVTFRHQEIRQDSVPDAANQAASEPGAQPDAPG
jgi:hypothetical protein